MGTFPEATLRIRGMGNQWALSSFVFKAEHTTVRDALVAEQAVSLIFGNTSKSLANREKILTKAILVQHQIDKSPFSFAFGRPSSQNWVSYIDIENAMWLQSPAAVQFLDLVETLFSDATSYDTWMEVTEKIRSVCLKVSAMALQFDIQIAEVKPEAT
eukprot:494740-Amphidinium_carterae.2